MEGEEECPRKIQLGWAGALSERGWELSGLKARGMWGGQDRARPHTHRGSCPAAVLYPGSSEKRSDELWLEVLKKAHSGYTVERSWENWRRWSVTSWKQAVGSVQRRGAWSGWWLRWQEKWLNSQEMGEAKSSRWLVDIIARSPGLTRFLLFIYLLCYWFLNNN